MTLWDKLAQDARLIKVLLAVGALGYLLLFFLGMAYFRLPRTIRVYQIPGLESVATEKVTTIPKASVYAFTFYLWQMLNHWPHEGSQDAAHLIEAYRSYLTPSFAHTLLEQTDYLKKHHELDRVRVSLGVPGEAYHSEDVVQVGPNAWDVMIKMQFKEYEQGVLVRAPVFVFPLRVVRYDIDRQLNPWGLAIDGYAASPKRLPVLDAEKAA